MTTALYRRYRPDTFTEVIGQEHVTEPLMQALRADRVTHAYLFSGPRGCGKTTSARILARCLNCAEGPTDTPCGRCDSCVELARGGAGSLDVVEIDAASHGGVDDARDLRERATFAPARDRFKIFILDEAHMVTSQGFNALLKIVEEPPPHIKFIFATTEPDKVIGTIRSRTHHYPFRLVPPDVLQPYLEQVCQSEGVPVGAGVLPLVVRAGGGSVRDSLSVLDQLVAGADASGLDYERAVALLGYTHAALLDDTVEAIAARDGASAFRVIDRVISSGHEPRRFVEDLLERLRDLIVIAASGEAARAVLRDLPADQLARMQAQAATLGPAELSRSADLVNDALTAMTGATSPRLHLELLAARLLLPAVDDGARGLGARVEKLERDVAGGVARPAPQAAPVPEAAPTPQAAPATESAVASDPAPAPRTPDEPPAPGHTHVPGPREKPAEPAGAATPSVASAPPVPAPAAPARAEAAPAAPAPAPPVQDEPSPAPRASSPAPASAPPASTPAPPAPALAPAGGMDAETVRRRWPEVLQTLRGLRMATWVLVSQNAQVGELAEGRLALAFTTPQLATTFRQGSHAEHVQRALHETLGLQVRVEPTLGAAAEGTPAASAASGSEPTPSSVEPRAGAQDRRPEPSAAPAPGRDDEPPATAPPASTRPASPRPASPPPASPRPAVAGVISTEDAEASWGAPAAPRSYSDQPPTAAVQTPAPPATRPESGAGPARPAGGVPRAAGSTPAAPTGSPASSDGIPDAPEPPSPDDEPEPAPPWDVPSGLQVRPASSTSGPSSASPPGTQARPGTESRPGGRPAAGTRRPGPAQRNAPAPARSGVDDGEDADPDDPDLVASGLVGAPLVAQMLGGTVIDEIPED